MNIGYVRVSTDDQLLDLQIDALKNAGCEQIFEDHMSGAVTTRPGLTDALSHLRKGDVLVIWKLDRLGRSVKGLVDLVAELEKKASSSAASPIALTPARPLADSSFM